MIVNKVTQKVMIAQEKYCEIIYSTPSLLGELIKNINGTISPDNINRHLQRKSKSIRMNVAFIKTLKDANYTEDQIFEKESVKSE